jgi:Flp pilus assembly protein TadG
MNLINRFRRDEKGNVVITFALLLPVVVAGVGAAVSYSTGSAARTSMQNSLDAAVLAAAASSDLTDASSASAIDTASKYFQNNVGTFARNSAKEIAATFAVNSLTISGQATGSLANPYGGVIGSKTYAVAVRSSATKASTPVCVLGLNGLDNGAFDINGNPTFNADCAVQANSNSSSGMTQEGKSAVVKAKKFGVKGGHKTETYSPPPTDGSAAIKDPYASIPFPAYTACDDNAKGLDIKNDTTLSPGTYCGGIKISGDGPKVTLQPGIYVMVGGPFWTTGSPVVTGDRVMIAFTAKDSSLYIWGNSSVKLTSPTSGTYMNMQFMSDRDNADTKGTWVSIGGSNGPKTDGGDVKLQIDGVAYFPTQNFWTFGNAVLNANSPSVAIVADKIWTQGNATVNVTHDNPRNLAVSAGPTTTFGARLIK